MQQQQQLTTDGDKLHWLSTQARGSRNAHKGCSSSGHTLTNSDYEFMTQGEEDYSKQGDSSYKKKDAYKKQDKYNNKQDYAKEGDKKDYEYKKVSEGVGGAVHT